MSANEEKQKKPSRPRRECSAEFKAGAVTLVLVEGKSLRQVARDLDLTESALRLWVEQTKTDQGEGKPGALTTAEREELARLRKENRELRLEREILKMQRPSSRRRWSEVLLHRREEGLPPGCLPLSSPGRLAQWLLRLGETARVRAKEE
ncbi:transposase [Myxococcus sp. AB025B]|uniref:transposase n=1 Tax=Myxococcus sp. AB025B TaxID=2562794 RepID=UPI0011418C37|nr:transposase [Myxococcus sp. AB025B]